MGSSLLEHSMLTPKHRALFAAAYSAQLLRKAEEPVRPCGQGPDTSANSNDDNGKGEVRPGKLPAA
jgi:hypothetical protein